eukprot:Hpha_TRINITY_DN16860_c1_g8::TRINITY_DN16860_c1_g8_i1::g.153345::m.153345
MDPPHSPGPKSRGKGGRMSIRGGSKRAHTWSVLYAPVFDALLMWLRGPGGICVGGGSTDRVEAHTGGGEGGGLAATPLSPLLVLDALGEQGVSNIQGKVLQRDVVEALIHTPVPPGDERTAGGGAEVMALLLPHTACRSRAAARGGDMSTRGRAGTLGGRRGGSVGAGAGPGGKETLDQCCGGAVLALEVATLPPSVGPPLVELLEPLQQRRGETGCDPVPLQHQPCTPEVNVVVVTPIESLPQTSDHRVQSRRRSVFAQPCGVGECGLRNPPYRAGKSTRCGLQCSARELETRAEPVVYL